jgi:hypothetical protein
MLKEKGIYNQYGIYGNLDDYDRYLEDSYRMGEELGEGRPFEVEVKIVGGSVINLFEVVKESCIRIDVFIFERDVDREKYFQE